MDKSSWCRLKPKLNLVIDAIMLIVMMAIVGIGFLIKYILIPGYKRNIIYSPDVELYYLGLTRHQWGTIHLWLGFFLLLLLLIHVVLHWQMILCIFRKMVKGRASRRVIAFLLVALSLLLCLGPLMISPYVEPLPFKGYFQHSGFPYSNFNEKEVEAVLEDTAELPSETRRPGRHQKKQLKGVTYEMVDINGSMTISDAASKYSISADELSSAINIPTTSKNMRIGRLKRRYGLEMNDIKEAIVEISNMI